MGTDGVFLAEPVSNVIGGTLCFVIMLCTVLPELKQMERENVSAPRIIPRGYSKRTSRSSSGETLFHYRSACRSNLHTQVGFITSA